jgi:hypothetical protein
MLPASKNDFPKCLYLDQNKWIDLARAHYGLEGGKPFGDALAAIRKAIASGRLVVPISAVHIMETVAPEDGGRRRRMAEFLVDLSGNRSVLPPFAIQSMECIHAVSRLVGRAPITHVRPALVTEGMWHALGGELEVNGIPDEMRAEINALIRDPKTTVDLLVDSADRQGVRTMRVADEASTEMQDEVRRRAHVELSTDQRRANEMFVALRDGDIGKRMLAALRLLQVPPSEFWKRVDTQQQLLALIETIPTVHTLIELMVARDQDLCRKIHRNDTKDMMFMSVALPYANAIVAEKYWSHQATATGLAQKYSTTVETDAERIPELLNALGCVP